MTTPHYTTFGRSGLVVSPLALGTMTFGAARWGATREIAKSIFDGYIDNGGNFVDTANVYSGGRSEEMLGEFVAERKLRDSVVIATKAGFGVRDGLLSGGNGAKHICTAVEGSLRRLRTDYIDMFWVHVWDSVTPAEELLETMTALRLAGKIRYWGISNAPAWYVAKLATLAAVRGAQGPIALQYFYSLVNRDIEDEHVPLAAEFDMAIQPWSPLGYGLLSGKYDRDAVQAAGSRAAGLPREAAALGAERADNDKRLDGPNPFGDTLFTERNWAIVAGLKSIADEAGTTMARVALAWLMQRPGVGATLIGVSRIEQLADSLAAADTVLSEAHLRALDVLSAQQNPRMLYSLFAPTLRQHAVFGGSVVNTFRKA
jgi:aryl-alcohol dehydrogenase-like predicted oxidoreductase